MRTWSTLTLLSGLLLLGAAAAGGAPAPEVIDFARADRGAAIEAQHNQAPRAGYDAWAAIGKGHYFRSAGFPVWFVVRLDRPRPVHAVEVVWRRSEFTANDFTLQAEEEGGGWREIARERDWGGTAGIYRLLLAEPVVTQRLRFEASSVRFAPAIPQATRERLLKSYGESVMINRLSVYETTRIPALVSELSYRVWLLQEELDRLERVSWMKRVGAERPVSDLRRRVAELLARLRSDAPILSEHVTQVERLCEAGFPLYDVQVRRAMARLSPEGPLIGHMSSMGQPRVDVFEAETQGPARISAARGEREGFLAVVHALHAPLDDLVVAPGDLVGETGHLLRASECVRVFQADYLGTKPPSYPRRASDEWPDCLRPHQGAVRVARGRTQPFWVEVFVPEEAPAGLYRGAITLSAGGKASSLPVELRVWDFDLPARGSLPNVFSLSWNLFKLGTGKDPDEEQRRAAYRLMMEHRLSPTTLYTSFTPQPSPDDLARLPEGEINAINTGYIYSRGERQKPEHMEKLLPALKETERRVAEAGLKEHAFVYLCDEPVPSDYAEIVRRAKQVREITDLPRFAVLNYPLSRYPDELIAAADILCPLMGDYDPDEADRLRERGHRVWWYIVGWGFNVDQPAAHTRLFSWLAYRYRVDGVMQWTLMTSWRQGTDPTKWDGFSFAESNGVANYVYPGPGGSLLPTLRLKLLRDGLEDYEYLVRLAHLVEQCEKAGIQAEAVAQAKAALDLSSLLPGKDLFDVKVSPEMVAARRQALGEGIEALQRLLAGRRDR